MSAAVLTSTEMAQLRAVLVKLGRSYLEKQNAEPGNSASAETSAGGEDDASIRKLQPQ